MIRLFDVSHIACCTNRSIRMTRWSPRLRCRIRCFSFAILRECLGTSSFPDVCFWSFCFFLQESNSNVNQRPTRLRCHFWLGWVPCAMLQSPVFPLLCGVVPTPWEGIPVKQDDHSQLTLLPADHCAYPSKHSPKFYLWVQRNMVSCFEDFYFVRNLSHISLVFHHNS